MAFRAAILLAGEMLLLVDSRLGGDVVVVGVDVCSCWKSADVAVGKGFVTTDDSEGTAGE